MYTFPRVSRPLAVRTVSSGAGLMVAGLGAMVMAGWLANAPALQAIAPQGVPMKFNTAACFILAGVALWCLREEEGDRRWRIVGRVCAATVVITALFTLAQDLLKVELGIDQLLFRVARDGVQTPHPGRMATATALNFVMAGLALLGLGGAGRRRWRATAALAMWVWLGGFLSFIGYLYGVKTPCAFTPFSSMAMHTALGFVVLATGVLCAQGGIGPLQILTSEGPGGSLARRLLPFAIGIPLAVGWLRLIGERAGMYGFEFGLALFVSSNAVTFSVLVWVNAVRVNRSDAVLRESERRHRELIESLPQLVWTCRADGPCDYLSPQWVAYTGIPEAGQLGYAWREQIHPDDRERTIARWQETAGVGRALEVEFRIRRYDGVYRWFQTRAEPLRDADGVIVKWFGSNTDIDDRKRAEQALATEAARRQSLLDNAQDGIFILDHRFQVIETNASFAGMLGVGMAETLRLYPWDWDVVYPSEAVLRATWPELPAEPLKFESRIRYKTEAIIEVEISGSPVSLGKGEGRQMVFICRDITERKRTQEALARLNQELEATVEARTHELKAVNETLSATADQLRSAQRISHVGSWELDVATGRVQWSDELFRIVGLDPAGEPPNYEKQAGMFTMESWSLLGRTIEHAVATGEGYELELAIVRPDGERRWTIARAETTCGRDGRVARLSGTLQDVTELKRAQIELERATERMRLATAAGDLGIWDWTVTDNKLVWDETMYQLYGIARGAFSGAYEAWSSAIHPDDRLGAESALQDAVAGGKDFTPIFRIIRPDGAVRSIQAAALAHRDGDGKVVRMVGLNEDITERHEMSRLLQEQKNQLVRSNRDLEQFAYAASHDLQEPLRAVTGCAQILQRRYANKLDADADELIRHTVEGAQRMQTLIHDLLTYSRVGTQAKTTGVVASGEALRQALANLQMAIRDSGATITEGRLPAVRIDPGQLTQLFQNLVGNALKYRGERAPIIRVDAWREGKDWVFAVSDNGIGIEPRYFEQIFALFQRLHTRTEYAGTGIGLALCKKIVERHGGRIWLASTPATGSVFYFAIPFSE